MLDFEKGRQRMTRVEVDHYLHDEIHYYSYNDSRIAPSVNVRDGINSLNERLLTLVSPSFSAMVIKKLIYILEEAEKFGYTVVEFVRMSEKQ